MPNAILNIGRYGDYPDDLPNGGPAGLDRFFAGLPGDQHLILYAHGGLDSRAVGTHTHGRLVQSFLPQVQGGALLSIVWETGFFEELGNVLAGPGARTLAPYAERIAELSLTTAPVPGERTGRALLADAAAEPLRADPAVLALAGQMQDEPAPDVIVRRLKSQYRLERLRRGEEPSAARQNFGAAQFLANLGQNLAAQVAGEAELRTADPPDVARRVRLARVYDGLLRFLNVDDLLRTLWNSMKDRAAATFAEPPGHSNPLPGNALALHLQAWRNRHPYGRISLIGHSAGSILLSNLLARSRALPGLAYQNFVLLAPAITQTRFERQVMAQAQVARYALLGLDRIRERRDNTFIYPSSILYLLSEVIEGEPGTRLVGLQEQNGAGNPVSDFISQHGVTSWASDTPAPGALPNDATKHAGFFENFSGVQSSVAGLLNVERPETR